MRINRSVIVAVGIAGAFACFKKPEGDNEPEVVRPAKYQAGVNRTPVNGALATSLASPMVETLAIVLHKDLKSVEGKTLPQAFMAFAAGAQTAKEVVSIARDALNTVRAQVLRVFKLSTKMEALGILVAAIVGQEVEKISGLLSNPSQESCEMQAIGALASGLELGLPRQSEVKTLMAKLELTVQERALINETVKFFFTTVFSIVEMTKKFIVDNGLH
jgi:hypothetical protein